MDCVAAAAAADIPTCCGIRGIPRTAIVIALRDSNKADKNKNKNNNNNNNNHHHNTRQVMVRGYMRNRAGEEEVLICE